MVKTCPKCKAQVPAASQFCTCGYLFGSATATVAPKSGPLVMSTNPTVQARASTSAQVWVTLVFAVLVLSGVIGYFTVWPRYQERTTRAVAANAAATIIAGNYRKDDLVDPGTMKVEFKGEVLPDGTLKVTGFTEKKNLVGVKLRTPRAFWIDWNPETRDFLVKRIWEKDPVTGEEYDDKIDEPFSLGDNSALFPKD